MTTNNPNKIFRNLRSSSIETSSQPTKKTDSARKAQYSDTMQETMIGKFLAEHPWSDNTKDRYRRALLQIMADYPDMKKLTAANLIAWLEEKNWSNSTQWVAINAIRNFLTWRYGERHPALKAKIKRLESPPQRSLNPEQVLALLAIFDTTTPIGVRDLAICCLFLDSGLRVSELCSLKVANVDLIAGTLSTIVKGGNQESGVFSEYTAMQLDRWLQARASIAVPGVEQIFVGIGGLKPGTPMTRSGLQKNMRYWAERAGLDTLSPHDLRRTFATLPAEIGASDRLIAEAGRWKSTSMVWHYTRTIRQRSFVRYSPVQAVLSGALASPGKPPRRESIR